MTFAPASSEPDPFEPPEPLELSQAQTPKARAALVQRLSELASWPESRIATYERQLAADILVGLLRTTGPDLRQRCANGLVVIHDPPKALLRYLARDEIQVAQALIENGVGFDDSDLIATVRAGTSAHWLAMTRRKILSEPVTDALVQTGDVAVIEAVLRNQGARLSSHGVDMVVARSRQAASLAPLLVPRQELRPTQALVLFWWAPFDARMHILRRFAVDRSTLIEQLGDVFALAAQEGWADADTRKTLQVVERRQRNRAAATQSPYGSLEGAIAQAERGLDRALLNEMAHLSGVKPATMQQILSDAGGEAIGVYCKAVGLKRPVLITLWRVLRRPSGDPDAQNNPFGRTLFTFDTLATAKAQTVLRYWNWSFTADALDLEQVAFDDDSGASLARRNASLLLQRG